LQQATSLVEISLLFVRPSGQPFLPIFPSSSLAHNLLIVVVVLFPLAGVEDGSDDVNSSITSDNVHFVVIELLSEDVEVEVRNARDGDCWGSFLDVDGKSVTLQRSGERVLEIHLRTRRLQLGLMVSIVNPLGMNDILGDDMELQQLGQDLFTDRRKQVKNQAFGEFLPCFVVGNEDCDRRSTLEGTLEVVRGFGVNIVPVNGIFEAYFLYR